MNLLPSQTLLQITALAPHFMQMSLPSAAAEYAHSEASMLENSFHVTAHECNLFVNRVTNWEIKARAYYRNTSDATEGYEWLYYIIDGEIWTNLEDTHLSRDWPRQEMPFEAYEDTRLRGLYFYRADANWWGCGPTVPTDPLIEPDRERGNHAGGYEGEGSGPIITGFIHQFMWPRLDSDVQNTWRGDGAGRMHIDFGAITGGGPSFINDGTNMLDSVRDLEVTGTHEGQDLCIVGRIGTNLDGHPAMSPWGAAPRNASAFGAVFTPAAPGPENWTFSLRPIRWRTMGGRFDEDTGLPV